MTYLVFLIPADAHADISAAFRAINHPPLPDDIDPLPGGLSADGKLPITHYWAGWLVDSEQESALREAMLPGCEILDGLNPSNALTTVLARGLQTISSEGDL